MRYIEITTLDHAITFALQKKVQENPAEHLLTFGAVWGACAAAAPYLPEPVDIADRRNFAREIFLAVERLESTGVVWCCRVGPIHAKKLLHIGFTETWEQKHFTGTVFTHQERMGV